MRCVTVVDLSSRAIVKRLESKQGLLRLQKIMDEYVAGPGANYKTNELMLKRGLKLLELFREDIEKIGAWDLHDLLRCWELKDRLWCAECHLRHVLYREETRWPGYYYRADFPSLDKDNWKVFVNSCYDAATGDWQLSKKPYIPLIP